MRLPAITWTVLPVLKALIFQCAMRVSRGPRCPNRQPETVRDHRTFLVSVVDFRVARLSKFIDHSVGLKSSLLEHATDNFLTHIVSFVYHH